MIEKKQRMFRTLRSSERRKLLIAASSVTWIVDGNLFGSLVTDGCSLLPNIYWTVTLVNLANLLSANINWMFLIGVGDIKTNKIVYRYCISVTVSIIQFTNSIYVKEIEDIFKVHNCLSFTLILLLWLLMLQLFLQHPLSFPVDWWGDG